MWKSPAFSIVERLSQVRASRLGIINFTQSYNYNAQLQKGAYDSRSLRLLEEKISTRTDEAALQDAVGIPKKRQIGENVSRKDKINFLVSTLHDLGDSKDSVYGTLDAWAAWEQTFPLVSLKRALLVLEKEQQWHKIIQVIKWMLSRGQGMTMGTYRQLIRALDMDHRVEEAHHVWKTKVGTDLHSVPWQLCRMMISIYYRSNKLEELIRLFKGLEAFSRRPPEKSIVQKVANAYELLGLVDEKEKMLEKYSDLFNQKRLNNKSQKALFKKQKRGERGKMEDSVAQDNINQP